MSGSRFTIVADERLGNVHPGDVLRDDFLVGSDIPLNEVTVGAGVSAEILNEVMVGRRNVDASLDARLTRYFRMSEGFFLRLQNMFDLEEVQRSQGDELDRIVPRAA